MANTPSRPPTYPGGRPPKGRRYVATAREKLLADLHAVSDHLRAHDKPELANTVDDLLTPSGWGKLRRAVEPAGIPSKPISVTKDDLTHYTQASKAAGKKALTDDVLEGLRAFIAGDFSPAGYPRRSSGAGPQTTMSPRVPEDLREEFNAAAAARKDELGYEPNLGHVAKAWLAHKYPKPTK